MRVRRVSAILIWVLLAFAVPAQALQREYILGTSVNFSTGVNTQPPGSSLAAPSSWPAFYSFYPSLSLTSPQTRTSLNATYAFGFNRSTGTTTPQTQSHTGSLNYSAALSSRWNAGFSDTFTASADPGTFNALRSVAAPDGTTSLFSPVASGRSMRTNNASANLAWALDSESSVSISATHALTDYSGSDTPIIATLSTQQRFSGSVAYNQRTGSRESWSLSYRGSYLDSKNFSDSISHGVQIGYTTEIARDFTLQISAGLSRVNSRGSTGGYLGYDATVSLAKKIQANTFSLNYTQDSGQAIGVGSISETRRGAFGWKRAFGRKVTSFADVAVYRSNGRLDNPLNTRGVNAAGNIGFALTRTFSISGGATFQRTSGAGSLDFTQKRIFVSLTYSEPNLKRFR